MMHLGIWHEGDGFNNEDRIKTSLETVILDLEDT